MAKENSGGRGRSPKVTTLIRLWAASGGRCQFKGCNKPLYQEGLTWTTLNHSNVAHIVGSSPQGPRGSSISHEYSDNYENLMLLCREHHALIDNYPEQYIVELLSEMKNSQERKVEELLNGMNYPEAEMVILESPIKGNKDVHVDGKALPEALLSRKRKPASSYPIRMKINSLGSYKSPEYWKIIEKALYQEVRQDIYRVLEEKPELQIAVFPLAPIPLIAKLGEILSDKREVMVFQKSRTPNTWQWLEKDQTNSFYENKTINSEGDPSKIALILSITADISEDRVKSVYPAGSIYHINAENKGVDAISSEEDLKLFWQLYQKVCDQIKNNDRIESVAVFPAIPVSAAFEIGRRHMPKVHPVLHIYDDDHGFFETLRIGEV